MYVKIKWHFDIISDVDNDITVAIGTSIGNMKPSLIHVMAGKYWDVARELEKIN
ncbi:hypothetical protein ABE073_05165 [Lederbergia citrisecunda]|uniref:hypothetical protein n=1 Tax=Lederbergia citrisecunda TaxID=2833583 RepID=UPI003D2A65F7